MRRRLSGLACTLIVAASVTTTGCTAGNSWCSGAGQRPDGLTFQDLVGTYQNSSGRVTLRNNGTFATVGWPTGLDGATGDPRSRTGSGTWELTAGANLDWPVDFTFHKISGFWNSDAKNGGTYGEGFDVGGSRDDPYLYSYVGDPDQCEIATFTRSS